MKKLIALLLTALMAMTLLTGCAAKDDTKIRIAALKGPTGMGIVRLMDESYTNYDITIESAPANVQTKFISGEIDIAAVPVNLASVLYNKLDGDVVMLGVTTLGVLYILEAGNEIQSIADLDGKTVHATGQSSTPEYIFNYLLEKNGLTGKVDVQYVAEHSALSTLLASGEARIGMLPEPNVTTSLNANSDLRVAIDLTEEWNKVCDTECVQGVLIARKSFVDEHKSAIDQLLKDYKESSDYVSGNPDAAAALIVSAEILTNEAIAKQAIGNCNIVFYTGAQMKAAAEGMLSVLFDANPQSIGGKLPGSEFYYEN